MSTAAPALVHSPLVDSLTFRDRLLCILFAIACAIVCWFIVAAGVSAEEQREQCRGWAAEPQELTQQQELTQEGPAL